MITALSAAIMFPTQAISSVDAPPPAAAAPAGPIR
jgi:hypothetical protein